MHKHLFDPVDSVDACVYSSDILHDPVERAEFRKYLTRWLQQMDAHDLNCPNCGSNREATIFGVGYRYSCGAELKIDGLYQKDCPHEGFTE